MAIFRFFKMAAAAILDFSNFKFLMVAWLRNAELRLHAKFGRNRSKRGRDMAIFRFFMMAAAAILDSNFKLLTVGQLKRVEVRRHDKIWSKSVKTRRRYSDLSIFQDGGRRHLGFLKFKTFNGRTAQEG